MEPFQYAKSHRESAFTATLSDFAVFGKKKIGNSRTNEEGIARILDLGGINSVRCPWSIPNKPSQILDIKLSFN